MEGIVYKFTGKPRQYSTSTIGWTIVLLPKTIAIEIRDNFKRLEEGWRRMQIQARIGDIEWNTSIWFDTKHDTYMLPLNAKIRKKANIALDKEINVIIVI